MVYISSMLATPSSAFMGIQDQRYPFYGLLIWRLVNSPGAVNDRLREGLSSERVVFSEDDRDGFVFSTIPLPKIGHKESFRLGQVIRNTPDSQIVANAVIEHELQRVLEKTIGKMTHNDQAEITRQVANLYQSEPNKEKLSLSCNTLNRGITIIKGNTYDGPYSIEEYIPELGD
jgi:hypothetical protein